MPGLFGYWTMQGDTVSPQMLVAMGKSMQHLPGLQIEHTLYPEFGAGCTHLGYIQDSVQFVSDTDPFYDVWFDGEIYNQDELIRTYGLRRSAPPSDAALFLELWEQTGQDFLAKVNGIFSAAVYDCSAHQLTLVNDRCGFRPLYWKETDAGFAFAGEVKALLVLPSISVEIDPTAVDEWVSFGYLLGSRTWIKGVHLLPPATIMTVSRTGRTQTPYWSWHEIKQPDTFPNESEIVEALGQLWIAAIQRRVDDKRLGQFLSGGLDSRAILAALPKIKRPYHTVTFGKKGCVDEQIARRVARQKGVAHHFVEINAKNWLPPRIDAIWRTDGMAKLLDLHGAEALPLISSLCDVHLHGHLGDATIGGSYQGPEDPNAFFEEKMYLANPLSLDRSTALDRVRSLWETDRFPLDRFLINQRGRRFINTGLIMASSFVECRLPFFDNHFLDYYFSLPDRLRSQSYIYNEMLLRCFPEFYTDIPWQQTGLPISAPRWQHRMKQLTLFSRRILRKFGLGGFGPAPSWGYTDNVRWLRSEPARGLLVSLLLGGDAIYTTFISPDKARPLVREFLEEKNNEAVAVGLLLTFEIYLRQLYNREHLSSLLALHGMR